MNDLINYLECKKKFIMNEMEYSDPLVNAYSLGAYNLCHEILNIVKKESVQADFDETETLRLAYREEGGSGITIITGDLNSIEECHIFIENCFTEEPYMAVIHSAQRLFHNLQWEFIQDSEYEEYKDIGIDYIYVKDKGCYPIDKN